MAGMEQEMLRFFLFDMVLPLLLVAVAAYRQTL